MKTYTNLNEFCETEKKPFGLIIGNFDGVHLGHRHLLTKVKDSCMKSGLTLVVATFIPHPQKILNPDRKRFLISSYEGRRTRFEELGISHLVEFNFTRDLSTLSAQDFFESFLFKKGDLRKIFVGYDFALGANKLGTIEVIKQICDLQGIEVLPEREFTSQSQVVSSSLVRETILKGSLESASDLLGRNFTLEGVVIKGEGRGKKIGFPTANLSIHEDLLIPAKGVYVTRTKLSGMTYKSVTNIGSNPTFNNQESLNVETNIFDFSQDIYGERIQVEFVSKIRDERKFSTVNDLVEQIQRDVLVAKTK